MQKTVHAKNGVMEGRNVSAVDVTYRRLRQMLVRRRFAPGERLKELDLVDVLGVSRTPLREAFRLLEADGLITLSGRGAVVVSATVAETISMYAYRGVLEAFTSEQAALRCSEGDLAPSAIKRLWLLVSKVDATEDSQERADANIELHAFIAELSGNSNAAAALERVWAKIAITSATNFTDERWRSEVQIQHTAIAQAIEQGDPDRAFAVTRRHIEDAAEVFRTLSRETGETE